MDMKTKKCIKCEVEKGLGEFYKKADNKDGYRNDCKACIKIYRAKYWADNIDAEKARSKKWLENNKEHKAEYNRQWCKENRQKVKAVKKAYRKRNPEVFKNMGRRWRANNPEACREKRRRYRARKKTATVEIISQETLDLLKDVTKYCPYCSISLAGVSVDLDHIVPLSKGGTHSINNLIFCCLSCNRSKSDKPIEQFCKERGLSLILSTI